ncbi:phosphodiesterase [Mycobacterium sp. NPDC003323]
MRASEVTALPFRAGAAIRDARLFHPVGLLCRGRITRTADPDRGLPVSDGDVIGRISKGIGTPGGLPDFAGLAWRSQVGTQPWDVLMVSSIGRLVLSPSTSWSAAHYSTLMPFGYRDRMYWLRAQVTSPRSFAGLDVDELRRRLNQQPVVVSIEQAEGTGAFTPLAVLEFDRDLETEWPEDVAFDPTLNHAEGVTLLPGWLTALRRRAYRGSRQGRDAE